MSSLCVPITGPNFEDAQDQIIAAESLAGIVELRLDVLKFSDDELVRLIKTTALHVLLTCDETTDESTIYNLIQGKPQYIDIPCSKEDGIYREVKRISPETQVIRSIHLHHATPFDLQAFFEEMRKKPGNLFKIACKAQSIIDSLKILQLIQRNPKNIIGVSMGEEYGVPGRILAKRFGSPICFVALDEESRTAPGQPTFDECASYRMNTLHAGTAIYGLIGNPVDKSQGHIFHNKLNIKEARDAVYLKMRVNNDRELDDFIRLARELQFSGLSVTMPFKEAIIRHVDELKTSCGAVNTLKFVTDRIEGYNTDGPAALDLIERRFSVNGKTISVIGAGGLAKAIVYEAVRRGAHVTVYNRTVARAQEIAKSLGCRAKPLEELEAGAHVIIQATGVGLGDSEAQLPLHQSIYSAATLFFETCATPRETAFVHSAANAGAEVILGQELFKEQALLQRAIWFS